MNNNNIYAADFETCRANKEIEEAHVWAAGICKLHTEDFKHFNNIEDFLNELAKIKGRRPLIYFHNLSFDGIFILEYLIRKKHFTEGLNPYKLGDNQFYTLINDQNIYYQLTFKYKRKVIELRDSHNILPFKLEQIATNLNTTYKKLTVTIDYKKERDENYKITETELNYLKNDVLILKEALEKVEEYGLLENLTIGSKCLKEYKERLGKKYKLYFPDLTIEEDEYFRRAYDGGWVFCKNKNETFRDGITLDYNSLYADVMHSQSGSVYPVGRAEAFTAEEFEKVRDHCYFLEVNVAFKLKEGHLPFLQERASIWKTGNIINSTWDELEQDYVKINLLFTRPRWELFLEQYDIVELEILGGYYFAGKRGLFDDYINTWYSIKKNTDNIVLKQISKLMLNNLSGKFATSPFKTSVAPIFLGEEEKLTMQVDTTEGKGVYIPIAAYITDYARAKTVRLAQQNYDNFIYSDTDSVHLACKLEDVKGNIKISKELGDLKIEHDWEYAKYLKNKTYCTYSKEKGYVLKLSGGSDEVKKRILTNYTDSGIIEEKDPANFFDNYFKLGLKVGGNLKRKRILGGCELIEQDYNLN